MTLSSPGFLLCHARPTPLPNFSPPSPCSPPLFFLSPSPSESCQNTGLPSPYQSLMEKRKETQAHALRLGLNSTARQRNVLTLLPVLKSNIHNAAAAESCHPPTVTRRACFTASRCRLQRSCLRVTEGKLMETPEVPLSPSLSLCGAESAATIAPDSFEVRKRNGAESVEEPRRSLSICISKTSGMLKMSQCERNVVLMFSSLVQVARPASRPSG